MLHIKSAVVKCFHNQIFMPEICHAIELNSRMSRMKMSLSIFPFCPFCWQNETVKLAKQQNEQNENVFVDFLNLPILPILLAE